MNFEQEILKAQLSQEFNVNRQIVGTDEHDFIKSMFENLYTCSDRECFDKSWSGDLQKRFPNGGWRSINGARVFINGGKVVAGLGGFNGMIDKFFEEKESKDKMSAARKGQSEKSLNKIYRFEDGDMSYKQRIDSNKIVNIKEKEGKFYAYEGDKSYRSVPKSVFDYFNLKGGEKDNKEKESVINKENYLSERNINDIVQTLKNDDEDPNNLNEQDWKDMGVTNDSDKEKIKSHFNKQQSTQDKIKEIDQKKRDKLDVVEKLSKEYKQKYSNMDIESSMSKEEKQLKEKIANIHSEINDLVKEKRELTKQEKGSQPDKKDDKETHQQYFDLPDVKNINDLDKNISKILSQYGNREMASIQIESYLNENLNISKEWLKNKGIKTRDSLLTYLKNRQTKDRKDIVKEKKESKKEWDEMKAKNNLNNIINLALDQENKMQEKIK